MRSRNALVGASLLLPLFAGCTDTDVQREQLFSEIRADGFDSAPGAGEIIEDENSVSLGSLMAGACEITVGTAYVELKGDQVTDVRDYWAASVDGQAVTFDNLEELVNLRPQVGNC